MKPAALFFAVLAGGCAGGPQPPDWSLNASQALAAFQRYYLTGDPRAPSEFALARRELASTGREDLVARAELLRCAIQVASLEFGDCTGFAPLRDGAGPAERDYADYLAGNRPRATPESDDALSRLVSLGVRLRTSTIDPEGIARAVNIASSQGWRRPLLAWLGVQEKRARDAGDMDAARAIRRRIELISS